LTLGLTFKYEGWIGDSRVGSAQEH